jgi:hypothetical protein
MKGNLMKKKYEINSADELRAQIPVEVIKSNTYKASGCQ